MEQGFGYSIWICTSVKSLTVEPPECGAVLTWMFRIVSLGFLLNWEDAVKI
jgi:hypothetical protein